MSEPADSAISQREYIERVLVERDKLYAARFLALEREHFAAVSALEKFMLHSFASYKEAIAKAESAQQELNVKNNEFRGQLKDQSEMQMPRAEATSMFKSTSDRVTSVESQLEQKLETQAKQVEQKSDALLKQIDTKFENVRIELASLRESRSEHGGKAQGVSNSWAVMLAVVGLLAGLLAIGGTIATISILLNEQ